MIDAKIIWESGSAYDFFCSLRVLHEPGHYGLRPSWAAGVRSRVPSEHREILEEVQSFLFFPRSWLLSLPEPKNSETALWFLNQIPPKQRLLTLIDGSGIPKPVQEVLGEIAENGSTCDDDQEKLHQAYQNSKTPPRPKVLASMAALFSQPEVSGQRYLEALKSYHAVFFAEEENHIQHYLEEAVISAEQLASVSSLEELFETLSQGVRLGMEPTYDEWVFVPSYWISPLVSFDRLGDNRAMFLFGCRPQDVSLVSGEVVPEGVLRSFKSLGDSTRLRILKYLVQENIYPAEIARRLRLRAPTVTHHLKVLRLAGLVVLTLDENNERRYTARMDAIEEVSAKLMDFLYAKE